MPCVLNVKKKGRVLFWQEQEYQSKYDLQISVVFIVLVFFSFFFSQHVFVDAVISCVRERKLHISHSGYRNPVPTSTVQ